MRLLLAVGKWYAVHAMGKRSKPAAFHNVLRRHNQSSPGVVEPCSYPVQLLGALSASGTLRSPLWLGRALMIICGLLFALVFQVGASLWSFLSDRRTHGTETSANHLGGLPTCCISELPLRRGTRMIGVLATNGTVL